MPRQEYSCGCCLGSVGKTRKFLFIVVGIVAISCTGNNNEPKLVWSICQKAHHPALAEAMLPSTPFLCVLFASNWKSKEVLSVVVSITAAGCTSSNNEPTLGLEMCQKAYCPSLAEVVFPSTTFCGVCCLRPMRKATEFLVVWWELRLLVASVVTKS